MCLYPKKMVNKKYTATKKNAVYVGDVGVTNVIPTLYDERCAEIEIPCGNCIECRKEKANEWRVRMSEELKVTKHAYFVTFTFSPEELNKLCEEKNDYSNVNVIAKLAVRRFLERWRKQHKKSLKHWFVTELGHTSTERIHLHGIIFHNEEILTSVLQQYWHYGEIWVGDYCNQKTINYIVKYITKLDTDHKAFQGQIFCSPGIGASWLEKEDLINTYKYIKGHTRNDYVLENGFKTKLPTYYKNKIFNDEEREKIWIDAMEKDQTYVIGNKYSNKLGKPLSNIITRAQETNINLGYGNDDPEWRKKPYNVTEAMLRSTRKKIATKYLNEINVIKNNENICTIKK